MWVENFPLDIWLKQHTLTVRLPMPSSSRSRSRNRPKRWLPFSSNKEPERYYLLPGMGGKLAVAKRKTALAWALFLGGTSAAILGTLLYLLNTR